jgi:hypothetical protein
MQAPIGPLPGTQLLTVLSAFLLHTGSRHIQMDLTPAQKDIVSHPFVKKIILFCMFYLSTRSITWSFILLCAYFLLMQMLLNENHPLNLYSKIWLQQKGHIKTHNQNIEHAPGNPLIPSVPQNVDPQVYYQNLQKLSIMNQ